MGNVFLRKKINIAVLMALACPAGVALAQDEKPVKAPTVEVIGTREALASIPGSAEVVDKKTLENSRVFTTSEALRKVPGVNVRDEEGLGLRPNIGIRGLNPTRSSKVLLLEDGIPLAFAPYGENATYYHPPIDRFERIEVLKGSGQILYGPQTIGGVINYITPLPPARPGGSIALTGGNRDYFNGRFNYGGTWGGNGVLFDYVRKQGDGARDNTRSELNDANVKAVLGLGANQALTLRGNFYSEDSNVTYSGLTGAEYAANPRQNPFKNDFMNAKRYGASATHEFVFNDNVILTTNLYGSIFQRDWWRQSSNSGQRPNDSADAACGGMTNLNTTCGNEGRLRNYYTWGVEPRLRVNHGLFGVRSEADMGVRAHYETQDRRQENGNTPNSRTGSIVEDNERKNQAYSAFVQNRFLMGKWTVTPGVRVESINYERTNRLANGGAGVSGKTDRTEVIPGMGATYNPLKNTTLFAGVHRGFAPPATADVISNTGGVVDLGAEKSWNYELGVRSQPRPGVSAEATLFRMDFQNQIIPASVAGGAGATLTNAGETLHQGAELGLRLNSGEVMDSPHNVYLQAAYTYLPTAKFTGTRTSNITSGVSVSGNRLPYAPENLLTTTLGYAHASGFDARVEAVHVGDQFSDDLNTVTPTANGQQGLIPSYTIWNAAVNYLVKPINTTVFLTAKNLTDKTYIVDRTRGILPGMPRLIQAGFTYRF
ncbi:MAG: TonB-dependent siderophore receptor [Gammaproteobacteria bacterium]|nr:TonB-dependent siderophore receptor [Gammaproteobacteria bacterium]